MISKAKFFRGAYNNESFTGEITVHPSAGFTWRLNGSSSPAVKMHDARTLVPDDIAYIWNAGATTITVRDNTGASLGTIVSGAVKKLILYSNATQAGIWKLSARTFL